MTTITKSDIKKQIKTFILAYLSMEDISDDYDLFETGLVNSAFAMQLVMFLEKEFGIIFQNDDLEIKNFQSIRCICDFIFDKQNMT
jgi:methoxymalonate biosynthesis acyl carrier protein